MSKKETGIKFIYDSHGGDTALNDRTGQSVVVLRALTEKEADIHDVGKMFCIRFEDGFETDAFADELILDEFTAEFTASEDQSQEDKREKLLKKIEAEQAEWESGFDDLPLGVIMDAAEEYHVRQTFLHVFENMELSDKEIDALMGEEELLTRIVKDYMKYGGKQGDVENAQGFIRGFAYELCGNLENERLNTALYEKLFEEQEQYRAHLLGLSPQEILDHGYEYYLREDILLSFECNDLPKEKIVALMEIDNLMAKLLETHENTPSTHMDDIWRMVESYAEEETEKQRRNI